MRWWTSCTACSAACDAISDSDSDESFHIEEESGVNSGAEISSSLDWSASTIAHRDHNYEPVFPPAARTSLSFGFPSYDDGTGKNRSSRINENPVNPARLILLTRLKARARRKLAAENTAAVDPAVARRMLGKFMLEKFLNGFVVEGEVGDTAAGAGDIDMDADLANDLGAYLDADDPALLDDIGNRLGKFLKCETHEAAFSCEKLDAVIGHWWRTVQWRISRRPHEITLESTAAVAHRCYLNGYDRTGRPVMYLKLYTESAPGSADVKPAAADQERMMAMLEERVLCMMEHALKMLADTQSHSWGDNGGAVGILLIVDCSHQGSMALASSMTSASLRAILEQMSTHYPDMLYRSWIVGAPFAVRMAWRVVQSWIHPVTRSKIHFVEPAALLNTRDAGQSLLAWSGASSTLRKRDRHHRQHQHRRAQTTSNNPILALVDAECLEHDYGGQLRFNMDPTAYADRLHARCSDHSQGIL